MYVQQIYTTSTSRFSIIDVLMIHLFCTETIGTILPLLSKKKYLCRIIELLPLWNTQQNIKAFFS